ncbi:hypothetical protein IHE55_27320 [Streptomyces pactum]|uniref:Uncharacterized protein n=1 Tax=Streptomyces pactum TaxID=68249 RepID=A0ABS0NT20_9ACTN|nr:ribosome-inactivating family protein [Streptomyces pactum]MBH5338296.1 hypothetical protein [Streptomyces pactum]
MSPRTGGHARRLGGVLVRCLLALALAAGSAATVLERPAAATADDTDDFPAVYRQLVEQIRAAARGGERVSTSLAGPARARPTDLAEASTGRRGTALISLDAVLPGEQLPSVSLVIRREDMYVLGFYQNSSLTHTFFHFDDADLSALDWTVFGNVRPTPVDLHLPSRYAGMADENVFQQWITPDSLRMAVRQLAYTNTTPESLRSAGHHLARLIMTLLEGARNREVEENIHNGFAAEGAWYAADDEPYIHNWAAMSDVVRNGHSYTLTVRGTRYTFMLGYLRSMLAILQIPPGSTPLPMCSGPVSGSGSGPCPPSLTSDNRRGALSGLPDWSEAGYRGGRALPGHQELTTDAACRITPQELAETYEVRPDDGADDSAGVQRAIDAIRGGCGDRANFDRLSLIQLPAGRLDISRQISVDTDHLVIRGAGSDPAKGTRIVFRPDGDTRYDTLTADGSRWDQDAMVHEAGADTAKGGWLWPGRGLFRIQTREVAARYADEWAAAPANRKDLYEGSVNQHWASGVKLRAADGDPGHSAREGDRVVHLDAKADMSRFRRGGHLWVGAPNTRKFYAVQQATDESRYENLHMRQQVFRIAAVDVDNRTVTLDKPLEFDLPVDSTSDGSAPIGTTAYAGKVTPLKMVVGVGLENFSFTQEVPGLTPQQAAHDYGNLAPAQAMHGVVFKWAADSWVRGVRSEMTGSHPIVTEVAKNLQIEGNHLEGAWNKGKGGNGYLRGSRVWDSLYAHNTTRGLRHFTLQWSASGNVVYGNDMDSDLNLHGGWERRNLFENNTVRVPYEHRSGSCSTACGGEGGEMDSGTWYPIWWAAGPKAVKWAGSSGPQNVFHNNVLTKQLTAGGPYTEYLPYSRSGSGVRPVYQFGSAADDPGAFRHLVRDGTPIADWNGHETADYTGSDAGVNASRTESSASLFLRRTE